MTRISRVRDYVEQADDLAAVLDAAYAAFEGMLSVIQLLQDPASGLFAACVMAAASAANGRDAVAFAPSLPKTPLAAAPAGEELYPAVGPAGAVADIAALSQLVAERLALASESAHDAGDRAACRDASQCASDIRDLLSGSGP